MKKYMWMLALLVVFLLPACGESQLSLESEEGILTYAALNPVSSETQRAVDRFNKNHEDVQIEIRDYTDEGGLERLQTELVLGKVPDIMEMHYFGKSSDRTREVVNGSTAS